MPTWTKWGIIIGLNLILLFIIVILYSRFQVKRKTRELKSQNDRLFEKEENLKKGREDLQNSISLLSATLQATADGILVVDNNRNISGYSQRFLKMWHLPDRLSKDVNDNKLLALILDQLKDPEIFLKIVADIYHQNNASSFDSFELIDGRIFECYSRPQIIDDNLVGRVWSFRDVTEHTHMVNAILNREKELALSNEALKALNEEYVSLNEEYLGSAD